MSEFIGFIETETARAILFQDHFWHKPDWMPKSQITMTRFHDTNEVQLTATNWICTQKKITEFEEVKGEANEP